MSRRVPNLAADRAAQNQQTIKSLLKLEGNKSCADCKRNKHPRWASWNLGVFVCIRCSGIHRGMGTHISRVKSVDLDSWTDEQLQSVLRWGNARANKYWEAKLAPGHVPSEAKIENFIRTKYESKRWVMEGPMLDPSTLEADGDDDVPLNIVQEKAKLDRSASQRNSSAPTPAPPPARKPAPHVDLIGGDDLPAPPARPSTTDSPGIKAHPPARSSTPSQLLGGLDFFGGPPERPASASAKPLGPAGMSRPDLKQSILSLYANTPRSQPQTQSPNSSQQPPQQHGRQPSFGGMQTATANQSSAFGGLDDAFSSLNFGTSTSTPAPQPHQQAQPSPFPSFGQISNQRSAPAPPQVSSIPLSGGGFFDTGPKPPPKPKTTAPPPQALRKISNASSGFGEFSSALNPMSGSSIATSINGLLDLSSPQSIASARPSDPPRQMSSIFNLSAPGPSSNYQPVVQSSAPPTKSTFSGISNADPWASNDAWATNEPAAPTPQARSVKSPSVSSATAGDFGWGNSPAASAGLGSIGSGGFNVQSPSGGGGYSSQSISPPKITAEEDFGGWNTAAPETPAATAFGAPSFPAPKAATQAQASKPAFNANPSEDLWSNVWE